jgi:hypothetical protein
MLRRIISQGTTFSRGEHCTSRIKVGENNDRFLINALASGLGSAEHGRKIPMVGKEQGEGETISCLAHFRHNNCELQLLGTKSRAKETDI